MSGCTVTTVGGYVFISYAHADAAYVERLTSHLRSAGVSVWVDDELITGDRWISVVRSHIDGCAALAVVMSPAADDSVWVEREIARAETMQKPIFPILLAGRPFFRLADVQYEDAVGGQMPSHRFVSTLMALVGANANEGDDARPRPGQPPRASGLDRTWAVDPVTVIRTDDQVSSLAFDSGGNSLAVATGTNTVRTLDVAGWRQRFAVRQVWHGNASVHTVAFGPILDEFATGGGIAGGGLVRIWDRAGRPTCKITTGATVWATALGS
jgi:TIR domain